MKLFASGKIILLLLIFFAINSCKKDSDTIPYVAVNIDIYLTDPAYVKLNAVGGWVYVYGGVKGIIVYRKTNDEFLSYERNCTYQPSDANAKVSVDASNVMAIDTSCGSKFQLLDGSVTNSPASRPLKQYSTTYSNSVVHIYN